MVLIEIPCRTGKFAYGDGDMSGKEIISYIASLPGIPKFWVSYNGQHLEDYHIVPKDSIVYVVFKLLGGKGGFGSMLRAIGAQIEKTTNREACRDLSGRRLRDINEEQRLKKWISKKDERESEKVQRRQARIERLKSKPKHVFVDFEYEKAISQLPESVDEALFVGIEKVKKRPQIEGCSATPSKKKKLWMGDDLSSSSDSDSQESPSSSGNANSDVDNIHPSRSEASDGDSSKDSDTTEKKASEIEEEETSLNAIEKNQVSSNTDQATKALSNKPATEQIEASSCSNSK